MNHVLMKVGTRSQVEVLADLTSKLRSLPPKHPYRSTLARMILGLRVELAMPQIRSVDPSGFDHGSA
jgi:hypothetical protein